MRNKLKLLTIALSSVFLSFGLINATSSKHNEMVAKTSSGNSLTAESTKTITNIHLRGPNQDSYESLCVLIFVSDTDYTSVANKPYGGNLDFLDNIYFYTKSYKKIKFRDVYDDREGVVTKKWNDNHSIGVPVKGSEEFNGSTVKWVSFDGNVSFVSANGQDTYNVSQTDLYNPSNEVQPGWLTYCEPKSNCHTITYMDNDNNVLGYQREVTGNPVSLMPNPLTPEGTKTPVWKNGDNVFSNGTAMPNEDIVLTASYKELTYHDTELEMIPGSGNTYYIQLRNNSEDPNQHDQLYMNFLIKDSDYTAPNAEWTYNSNYNFLDKIKLYTTEKKECVLLKDAVKSFEGNPIKFKNYGETNAFGVPIKPNFPATKLNSVVVEEGCLFPSYSGDVVYRIKETGEYLNQSKTLAGWTTSFTEPTNPCHTVTATDDKGNVLNYRYEEGATITLPELPPSQLGYSFKYTSNEVTIDENNTFVMPNKDVSVTATEGPKEYKITYLGLEGADPTTNPNSYTIVSNDITLTDASKTGYDFLGWTGGNYSTPTKGAKIVTGSYGDLEFTAHFSLKSYTVTFDTKGGSNVDAQTVEFNKLVNKPQNPTKDGVSFLGWFIDEEYKNEYDFSTPVSSDLVLYAKWATTVTVTFNSDGGSEVSSLTLIKGEKITSQITPTKTGYEFEGWFNGNDKWNFDNSVNEDITLTAHWKKIGGGCGGSVIASASIVSVAALGAALLLIIKKKKKEN